MRQTDIISELTWANLRFQKGKKKDPEKKIGSGRTEHTPVLDRRTFLPQKGTTKTRKSVLPQRFEWQPAAISLFLEVNNNNNNKKEDQKDKQEKHL